MSTSSSHSSLSSGEKRQDDDDNEETGEGIMNIEDADSLVLTAPMGPPPTLHPLPLRTEALVRNKIFIEFDHEYF